MKPFINPSLLPPPLRRDLNMRSLEVLNAQTSKLPLSPLVIYDFDHVEASALPHLAEQLNALGDLGWELSRTDAEKREYLKQVVAIKKLKGTPHSIREIFRILGLGEVVIHEGRGGRHYDGQFDYDGFVVYDGRHRDWAVYRVVTSVILTNRMANKVRALLSTWAPARCHLWRLECTQGTLIYNAFATYDGAYNYGAY